jgi:hypothetical protein
MVRAAALMLLLATSEPQPAPRGPWDHYTQADDRWLFLTRDSNGTVWELDTQRSDFSSESPTVWIRFDHSKNPTVAYRSSIAKVQIDCKNLKSRIVTLTNYRANNTSVSGYASGVYEDIIPGSVMEDAASFLCAVATAPPAR